MLLKHHWNRMTAFVTIRWITVRPTSPVSATWAILRAISRPICWLGRTNWSDSARLWWRMSHFQRVRRASSTAKRGRSSRTIWTLRATSLPSVPNFPNLSFHLAAQPHENWELLITLVSVVGGIPVRLNGFGVPRQVPQFVVEWMHVFHPLSGNSSLFPN